MAAVPEYEIKVEVDDKAIRSAIEEYRTELAAAQDKLQSAVATVKLSVTLKTRGNRTE
jgi:hypothetical protein